jgi:ATP-dependent exoDNAse (exonuclease V) beta subunit
VSAVAPGAGLSPSDEEDVARLVRAASAGSLPSRLSRAVRFTTEFPFAVMLPDGGAGDGLLEGRIDLLIEEPDGCVLVDYKTDRVPRGEDASGFVRERAAFYRAQAAAYAVALDALGASPRSAILVFLDAGREATFTVDPGFLALGRDAAIRSLRDSV